MESAVIYQVSVVGLHSWCELADSLQHGVMQLMETEWSGVFCG